MNDALACPRRPLLEGGGYQTPTRKSSLTADSPKDRLWKLPDLTGLWTLFEDAHVGRAHSPLENLRFPTGPWTRFEEAHVGHAPTSFHSPLPPERLKGEIDREDTQTLTLPSAARNVVRGGGGGGKVLQRPGPMPVKTDIRPEGDPLQVASARAPWPSIVRSARGISFEPSRASRPTM